ncbi:hypothetical protein, partial [Pseudomonas sp. PS02290]|uniref:hypothetical protein n=1 Tax=Pseudomonas sp. PS02290 TaxID=2991430 RepID=UPI00249C18BF
MEKTAAAKHSADYRRRQKEEKEKLGIQTLEVDVPVGTRSGMTLAMKDHGYKQIQELWQDLALSFLAAPREEQARRLRKPSASDFVVTPRLARQLKAAGKAQVDPDA